MRNASGSCLLALFCTFAAVNSLPAEENAEETKAREQIQKVIAGLNFQKGEISLSGGIAKLNLPENLRYLNPKDTETVLVSIWGNPPDPTPSLGLIVPAEFNPLGENSWAVDINYEEDGYIKDNEADAINYNDLLKKMQEGAREANPERVKAGYEPVEVIGWAATPRYDKETHKLYWAKEFKFGDSSDHTLNYNIRILGRKGVLVLNAIAGMPQLAEIEAATPEILSTVEFTEGHRYTDFNPNTDRVATYGIAALVAGGIATKAGLFKTVWIALLAGKKFVIVGAIALFAAIKKFFGRKE